ncbi:MAG: hypothetical protein ACRC1D_03595 [Culicoidibacterales bacterium]
MTKITDKLTIGSIEASKWTHDDRDREITTCFLVHFSFCGFDGFRAFWEDGDFPRIESDEGDLHDSFMDAIEDNKNAIASHILQWEKGNFAEQTKIIKRIEQNRIDAGLV